jgi:hypothetical protein
MRPISLQPMLALAHPAGVASRSRTGLTTTTKTKITTG